MAENWTEEQILERGRRILDEQEKFRIVQSLHDALKQSLNVPKIRRTAERDLERACGDLLQLDGWRLLKTDPVSDRARGKGFGELGMADCLYIRYGSTYGTTCAAHSTDKPIWLAPCQVMWIEWKSPGGKAKAHQKAWHAAERARGALVVVAGEDFLASVEDFLRWYRTSGLMRRKL